MDVRRLYPVFEHVKRFLHVESSALFFQPVAQCCSVFCFFFSYKFLGWSGKDGVKNIVVLYCPECLCAGYPEAIFFMSQ